MGKVVIATYIPANRIVLGTCKCGVYISSTNPKEISNAILYLYKNKKMLKKWGSYGKILIENRYGWNKVADVFEAYLINL